MVKRIEFVDNITFLGLRRMSQRVFYRVSYLFPLANLQWWLAEVREMCHGAEGTEQVKGFAVIHSLDCLDSTRRNKYTLFPPSDSACLGPFPQVI